MDREKEISQYYRQYTDLAVQNKFATRSDIDHAFSLFTNRLKENSKLKLDQFLVNNNILTDEQAEALFAATDRYILDKKNEQHHVGGYQIIGKLGEGGLGVVYRAVQLSMRREVALKLMHPRWNFDEEFKRRFLLEARLLGKLHHEHLVQVIDVGKEQGALYFSMELVQGQTIDDLIEKEGPLQFDFTVDVCYQVAKALKYLWHYQIVHRDIKPGNIMVDSKGNVKLIDFGFVMPTHETITTEGGLVVGTPEYISPEQARGDSDIDVRSDIYSLGASMWHMLAGVSPFDGSASTVMRTHFIEGIPSPLTVNPAIPDELCKIVEKMTSRQAEERYQSPEELIDDLSLFRARYRLEAENLPQRSSVIYRALVTSRDTDRTQQVTIQSLEREVNRLRLKVMSFVIGGGILLAIILVILLVLLFSSKE